MKKIKITRKEFDSILNMLDSDDKENKVVGLNTLNNLDFKSNLTMLFLLKKKANVSTELWTNNSTKTYKYRTHVINLFNLHDLFTFLSPLLNKWITFSRC